MFTVTAHLQGFPQEVVDLVEEEITNEDALKEYLWEQLCTEDDDTPVDDYALIVDARPGCGSLDGAFEYVEWIVAKSFYEDAEAIAAAASALDISADDIDEAYQGEFNSRRDFILDFIIQVGAEIPDWIAVDYEATWEASLRFDYDEHDDHYFRIM